MPNTEGLIPWKPGQSGNPSGRAKGHRTPGDHLRYLLADGIDEAALRKTARDKKAAPSRRIAAKAILAGLAEDDGKAGPAIDRLLDRTEGRPTQGHLIAQAEAETPEQVLAGLRRSIPGYERRLELYRKVQARLIEAGGEADGAEGE